VNFKFGSRKHDFTSPVSHMNESCVTFEWVMKAMTLWVMSHLWISEWVVKVTTLWVISHLWIFKGVVDKTKWVVCHMWVSHKGETWRIQSCWIHMWLM